MNKIRIKLKPGFIMVYKHNEKNRAIEYRGNREYLLVYTDELNHPIDKEKVLICLN